LRFQPGLKTQDRINWRVRYIEGDLTPAERRGLRSALVEDVDPLTDTERRTFLSDVSGVSMVSDGFIPFRDNVDHAAMHGVRYMAEPGGSSRDSEVESACREHGIALVYTNLRLFHH
jgi:phosphoribosylaminoimidazolecarboxamide formyltransferase / IMP cyclohydrolase